MLSVGRCGVARLQMKFGHMDGMRRIIDGTSILVKIKSVALYNCRTVYESHKQEEITRGHIRRVREGECHRHVFGGQKLLH